MFILGAGFSKSAGLPLGTELTDILIQAIELQLDSPAQDNEQLEWIRDFRGRLHALEGGSTAINVEQLFDYAHHDAEMWRMDQQRVRVGRGDGPATPWNHARMIDHVLGLLQEQVSRVILERQRDATVSAIVGFAQQLRAGDGVITFNYDTLVENALDECKTTWSHGLQDLKEEPHVVVLKMHGSADWFQFERGNPLPGFTRLYSKTDENASDDNIPDEYEYRAELWRADTTCALDNALERYHGISDRYSFPGIVGLGGFKPLHKLVGSGLTWSRAGGALREAKQIIVIGFSLSPYDGMARLCFADAMNDRKRQNNLPKEVRLIDPNADLLAVNYKNVFQVPMLFDTRACQDVNWPNLLV
ncbi:MAG: hypothetical protein HOK71_05020 [Planctomycetaceae bacterium]|nr:hypothetical protein [Planctomycetaceae bacterium]MBT6484021.1 hypothetical protein [Planctomycetaceae bacterium]